MASPLLDNIYLLVNQLSLSDLKVLQQRVGVAMAALTPPPPPPLMTDAALREAVIKMQTRDAYKASWKKFVNKGGVIPNVFRILEDCYPSLRSKDSNEDGFVAARALGGRDSLKWQEFKLRVIHYLTLHGSFHKEGGGFDDFEDTAGGCDEITWDAACYLLANPAWSPV
jgi:hypothetical protein